jgi:hypothetical protein
MGPGKEYETPEGYLRASILNPGEHLVDGVLATRCRPSRETCDRGIDALDRDDEAPRRVQHAMGRWKPEAMPNAWRSAAGAALTAEFQTTPGPQHGITAAERRTP